MGVTPKLLSTMLVFADVCQLSKLLFSKPTAKFQIFYPMIKFLNFTKIIGLSEKYYFFGQEFLKELILHQER